MIKGHRDGKERLFGSWFVYVGALLAITILDDVLGLPRGLVIGMAATLTVYQGMYVRCILCYYPLVWPLSYCLLWPLTLAASMYAGKIISPYNQTLTH